jgi:hypothetical protein
MTRTIGADVVLEFCRSLELEPNSLDARKIPPPNRLLSAARPLLVVGALVAGTLGSVFWFGNERERKPTLTDMMAKAKALADEKQYDRAIELVRQLTAGRVLRAASIGRYVTLSRVIWRAL